MTPKSGPLVITPTSSVSFTLADDGTPVLVFDGVNILDGNMPVTTTAETLALWAVGLVRFTAALLPDERPARPRADA